MTKTSGGLRHLLLSTSLVASALLMSGAATAALPVTPTTVGATTQIGGVTVRNVAFENNGITMSGNLYLPKGFSERRKYSAIVVVHPGGGVKEQTAGLYALKMAEQGFVTLAFDASHQGASGGLPRFIDDPMKRVGDIYSAVDYLVTLNYVDAGNIGALGICAGSGHTVRATTTDRRIKAVAIVSGVDTGAMVTKDWNGAAVSSDQIAGLEAVAQQRTAEARGAAPRYGRYVPNVGDRTAPRDLQEAAEYYLTARGQHPNAPNKRLITGEVYATSYSGFAQVETLLTQPLLMIAGSEAGSLWHSVELNAKAASRDKELFIIAGATHMDLYDGAGAEAAARKLAPFFKGKL